MFTCFGGIVYVVCFCVRLDVSLWVGVSVSCFCGIVICVMLLVGWFDWWLVGCGCLVAVELCRGGSLELYLCVLLCDLNTLLGVCLGVSVVVLVVA